MTSRSVGALRSASPSRSRRHLRASAGFASDEHRLFILRIQLAFEIDVPETQVDWALSGVGSPFPTLYSDGGLCFEPAIWRCVDLWSVRPQLLERQIAQSLCAFRQHGRLIPIGIGPHPSPAHIAKSYLRYVVFQWLDASELGRLKIEWLRDALRAAIALALLDRLGVDLAVHVGKPQLLETALKNSSP